MLIFEPSSARSAGDFAAPSWRRNQEILRNVATLVGTTGVTALLGLAFWAVAARLFSQAAIGYAAATTSAMTLLGEFGMVGLGTLLIAELPRRRARASLVAASMITSGLAALLIGMAFVLIAPHVSGTLRNPSGTLIGALVFTAGVIFTASTFVFDAATIGLLRGELQLTRNVSFAAAKLVILPAAAYVLGDQFGTAIALSWVAGIAISVIPVAAWLWWKGSHVFARPDWRVLRSMGSTVAAHNWLNIAVTAPTLLAPVLVAVVVSPSANGAFYIGWVMAGILYMIPTHLSTVLVAAAATDPRALARKLRFTLVLSLAIGVPGMLVLGLGGHIALSIFGKSYVREAALPLSLLALAYLPMIPRMHCIAIWRSLGQVARAAAFSTVVGVAELAAIVLGAKWNGLVGLSVTLLGVRYVTGAAVTPTVLRSAVGRGRHRQTNLVSGPARGGVHAFARHGA